MQPARARVEERFGPAIPQGYEPVFLMRDLPESVAALAAQLRVQEEAAKERQDALIAKRKELQVWA